MATDSLQCTAIYLAPLLPEKYHIPALTLRIQIPPVYLIPEQGLLTILKLDRLGGKVQYHNPIISHFLAFILSDYILRLSA